MKNTNSINKNVYLSSLAMVGLVLASAGAQASVTLTQDSGAGFILNSYPVPIFTPILSPSPIFTPIPGASLNSATTASSVSGSLYYSVGSSYGNFSESDSNSDGSMLAIDLNRKGYAYRAEASSSVGVLKAVAATQAPSNNSNPYSYNYGNSSANASASWSDWFVISGGTGLGTANFESVLNGTLNSAKNGSASYSLNITYSTGAYCYYWYNTCGEADQDQSLFSQTSSLSGNVKSSLSQEIEGEFTFDYDKPFQLMATLNTSAANGGMVDLTLASLGSILLLPVGSQMLSASGLTVQAVPEAETYAMMLAGLGLVGFAARRRAAR